MDNFHLMAKPAGPACNLKCTYCFYLEKENLFSSPGKTIMSDEVLEAYTEKYIASQSGRDVNFAWQGGEPTVAGLEFFRKALKLQKKYNRGKKISNALQTNGTLINEEWCRFLAKHKFLVGLSMDGPKELHDVYRKNKGDAPTHSKVMKAMELFKRFGVEYNVLTTVNDRNSREPLAVYDFLKKSGVEFVQFIPIVEREAGEESRELGLSLSSPPAGQRQNQALMPWSVDSEAYGDFLIAIFEKWVRKDVGKIFIMNFEWAFSSALNGVSGVCQFAPVCGNAGIVEHNGEVYSCDHFVYPEYKIGNVLDDDPKELFNSPAQRQFGEQKRAGLTDQCLTCPVLKLCYGGCPKHRFDAGQNHLCAGYKKFFIHIQPYIEAAAKLISQRRPLTDLMAMADSL